MQQVTSAESANVTHLIGRGRRGPERLVRLPLAPVPPLAALLRAGALARRRRARRALATERARQAAVAGLAVPTLVPAATGGEKRKKRAFKTRARRPETNGACIKTRMLGPRGLPRVRNDEKQTTVAFVKNEACPTFVTDKRDKSSISDTVIAPMQRDNMLINIKKHSEIKERPEKEKRKRGERESRVGQSRGTR